MILDIISAALLLLGGVMALTAAIGIVRFPDTLSRMHAATKPQTFGLLLVLLGVLTSLPIPLTNFLFGGLLLLYALALLERDGVLMLVSWAAGLIAIAVFGVLSGTLAAQASHFLDRFI